jgi:DNA-binding XRE family transcriptional regulator
MPLSKVEHDLLLGNLKHYRTQAGLTQAQLAKRAGITTFTISRIETGQAGKTRHGIVEKLFAALKDIAPVPRPVSGPRPAGSRRLICPHCGSSSYSLSDIPGVEYKCVSCGRSFMADGKMPEPVSAPARVLLMHEMSAAARARISAGQRARWAKARKAR